MKSHGFERTGGWTFGWTRVASLDGWLNLLTLGDGDRWGLVGLGAPFHLAFTLGTVRGRGLLAGVIRCVEDEVEAALSAACLRCCWAYFSRATCEGSFSEKKPRTTLLVFFFLEAGASSVEDLLEATETWLADMRLLASEERRECGSEASESLVKGRSSR